MNNSSSNCAETMTVKKNQAWFVYIILTRCNALYTGISTDVDRRFHEHLACYQRGKSADNSPIDKQTPAIKKPFVTNKGAKYFRGREPVAVVYREASLNRSAASRREYEIKKMSTAQKRALIQLL